MGRGEIQAELPWNQGRLQLFSFGGGGLVEVMANISHELLHPNMLRVGRVVNPTSQKLLGLGP